MGACRELEQVIREIIRRIKEFDFEAILDDIGALKMPFLAHTGRKFDRFPDAAASPSCTPTIRKHWIFARRFASNRSNLPSIKRAAAFMVHINSGQNPIPIRYLRFQSTYLNLP